MIWPDTLRVQMDKMCELANEEHRKVVKACHGALNHARKSGEWLNRMRKYVPNRAWKRWISEHFDGSYETSKVYCRIDREWDNPKLKKARREGKEFTSIASVLKVLHATPIVPDEKDMANMLRQGLRENFASELRDLTFEVLQVFEEHFDDLWDVFFIYLKRKVRKNLGYDPDEVLLEKKNQVIFNKPLRRMSRREITRQSEKMAKEDMKKWRAEDRLRREAKARKRKLKNKGIKKNDLKRKSA